MNAGDSQGPSAANYPILFEVAPDRLLHVSDRSSARRMIFLATLPSGIGAQAIAAVLPKVRPKDSDRDPVVSKSLSPQHRPGWACGRDPLSCSGPVYRGALVAEPHRSFVSFDGSLLWECETLRSLSLGPCSSAWLGRSVTDFDDAVVLTPSRILGRPQFGWWMRRIVGPVRHLITRTRLFRSLAPAHSCPPRVWARSYCR